MTETHATVRAVFRMWTGADYDRMDFVVMDASACDLSRLDPMADRIHSLNVTNDGTLTRLPSCPVCGVLLTMAEESRRTE